MVREPFRLGAYAVLTVGEVPDLQLLLVPKAEGPYLGRLDLPGGGVDPFEDPEDTLVRELREECGIAVEAGEAALLAVRSVVFGYREADGRRALLHHVGVLSRLHHPDPPQVRPEPGEPTPEWVAVSAAAARHLTPFAWWAVRHLAHPDSGDGQKASGGR